MSGGLIDLAARLLDRFGRWRFFVGWLLVIFAVSSIPNYFAVSEQSRYPVDKLVHFSEYVVLASLLVAAAARWRRSAARRSIRVLALLALAAALVAGLYGVSDEIHQRYVHGRDPDIDDWAADAAGSVTGAVAAAVVLRRAESGSNSRT